MLQAALCTGLTALSNKGTFIAGVAGVGTLVGGIAFLSQLAKNRKTDLLNQQYQMGIIATRGAAREALKNLDATHLPAEARQKGWEQARRLAIRGGEVISHVSPAMRDQLINHMATVTSAIDMAEQAEGSHKDMLQAIARRKLEESTKRADQLYTLPFGSPWKSALKAGSQAAGIAVGSLIALEGNRKTKKRPTEKTPTPGVGELTPEETAEFEILETIHDRRPPMTKIKELAKKYGQERVLGTVRESKADLQFRQESGKLLDDEDRQRLSYFEEIERELQAK